ncbi:cyclic nucleotide-binding domain-containing protein [Pelagibius sp.]|uniref:cyclic nucleotide-binding domain-containing protein n=1 Tax=Pelagibius sp. TaxID=1931238 RepID=UPI000B16198B|nr:Crp/Fnr family transcriptional regulator [Pelagibius sp.]HIC80919.1 Crp/Fnr family transcriptional regulator [Kiloniellaceae bacterium]HIP79607.1 Crp/Fnr family transcriptional regulator [Kiloniellaceae bacterium]
MSIDQEVEILRRIPIFSEIDPAKLKLMAFASERLTFKPGQRLFNQGEMGDAAYIVLDGKADILVEGDDGPLRVAQLAENEIIGEIAILCDIPRTASVEAASQLTTLKITKDLFFRMIMDFPEMGVEVMRVLAHRLEQTTTQLRVARAAG